MVTIGLVQELAVGEPAAAAPLLREALSLAESSGCRHLRMEAHMAHADAAASHGDLADAIKLARGVLETASSGSWPEAVRVLGYTGLLAQDKEALRCAVEVGERALQTSPGLALWTHDALHRLQLLDGHASTVDPELSDPDVSGPPTSPGTLWLLVREAIDGQGGEVAVNWARAKADTTPHAHAVVAACEAAATGDESHWHRALELALDQGLRLITVDALEGLAVAASNDESWAECLRLLAAAQRIRHETGYHWRFGFEVRTVEAARSSATDALGNAAPAAVTEGGALDLSDAAAYVRRARGQRKRPRHGWASLTPTERQVVTLVADGLSNPQIAERLYIGRTTVKTHVEHIFAKLGVRTRAELAAKAARRDSL